MDWVIRIGLILFFLFVFLWGCYLVCVIHTIRQLEEIIVEQQAEMLQWELDSTKEE